MFRFTFFTLFALISQVAAVAVSTARAAEDTRVVACVSPSTPDGTHLIGGPIQLVISVVNTRVERTNEERIAAWQDEIRRIEAAGGIQTPNRPAPVEAAPDLLVELGADNLSWFDALEIRIERKETGDEVFSGLDWSNQISYPFALVEEPNILGTTPQWVTLEIPAAMSEALAPGTYRLVATGPWGEDSWEFEVAAPVTDADQARLNDLNAKWNLTYGSPAESVTQAEAAVASLADQDIEVVLTLARALETSGRMDEALEQYERYVTTKDQMGGGCYELESAKLSLEAVRRTVEGEK